MLESCPLAQLLNADQAALDSGTFSIDLDEIGQCAACVRSSLQGASNELDRCRQEAYDNDCLDFFAETTEPTESSEISSSSEGKYIILQTLGTNFINKREEGPVAWTAWCIRQAALECQG
ncbi:MAG TPA: hypothetical protein VNG32_03735 [Candidatus Dormibacteraeota bacterium]|nr:hypothetical protein [Candidatus Dormibacteraeota bacterium]